MGGGVWAAQEIQCGRRVARPPVGAFPENVFWHKSTPYERSRSIYECILHGIALRIFLEMSNFEDSSLNIKKQMCMGKTQNHDFYVFYKKCNTWKMGNGLGFCMSRSMFWLSFHEIISRGNLSY